MDLSKKPPIGDGTEITDDQNLRTRRRVNTPDENIQDGWIFHSGRILAIWTKGDGYQGYVAPTWLKWFPRNPKWKCLAPYD